MDIVKKNLVSIICGVIALLAAIAVFVWPLNGYYEELHTKADARTAQDTKIKSLMSTPRVIPPFDEGKPIQLTEFPSAALLQKAEVARKKMTDQSLSIYKAALALNSANHGLLVPGTLPKPISQPVALGFRDKMAAALARLRTEELQSGVPPTVEEKNVRLTAIRDQLDKEKIVVNGQVINQPDLQARFAAAADKLPGEMRMEMATKHKMYVDPTKVFKLRDTLPAGRLPDPQAIWWFQVDYWIYSDVVAAIKVTNAAAKNVTEAPIKNLIEFSVPDSFFPPTSNSAPVANPDGSEVKPGGGVPDPTMTLPDGAAITPTRRVSNNLYDVIHFKLVLDIEAGEIPKFLRNLGTNRFITVLKMDLVAQDSQLIQAGDYIYGPKPVANVVLDCEAVLMRDWTINYMPPTVREMLGIPAPVRPSTVQPN